MKKKAFGLISKDLPKSEAIDELLSMVDNRGAYNIFKQNTSCSVKRINAFDNELLQENIELISVKSSSEDTQNKFKELDFELKQLDNKIKLAQKEKQYLLIKKLYVERYNLLKKMEILNTQPQVEHKKKNTFYWHFVESIVAFYRKIYLKKLIFERYFQTKIWTKFIKLFCKSKGIREAVDKLNELNRSVNNLKTYTVPFGEQAGKYDELVNCLTQIPALQTAFDKNIKHVL